MPEPRRIMTVFPHPDDETSGGGGTIGMSVAEGVEVHVICATRGELGGLGTNGVVLTREELPQVRESELRAVLHHYGVVSEPCFLNYRDQELEHAPFEEAVERVLGVMSRVKPDVVFTFGPTGISRHPDHIAMHGIATEAFHRHRAATGREPRLLYDVLLEDDVKEFGEDVGLDFDSIRGIETTLNIQVHVGEYWDAKVAALRLYSSQEDAQRVADVFGRMTNRTEYFHQGVSAAPGGHPARRPLGLATLRP
jgi:LmbE family N-acetylglucosaminyl deacetylase